MSGVLSRTSIACWIVFGSVCPVDAADLDTRSALLEGTAALEVRLLDRVSLVLEHTSMPTGSVSPVKRIIHYRRSGMLYALQYYSGAETAAAGRFTEAHICDGLRVLRMSNWSEHQPLAPATHAALDPPGNAVEPFGSHLPLSLVGWIENDISPKSVLLQDGCSIVADELAGISAYRVSSEQQMDGQLVRVVYWLAAQYGCAPLAVERTVDGVRFDRRTFADFSEVLPGVWLPRTLTQETYDADGAPDFRSEVSVKAVDLTSQIEDALFSTDLAQVPEGAVVSDRIHGLSYVKAQGPISDSAIQKVVAELSAEFPELLVDSSGNNLAALQPLTPERSGDAAPVSAAPRSARWAHAWVGIAAASALIMLVLILLVRCRYRVSKNVK